MINYYSYVTNLLKELTQYWKYYSSYDVINYYSYVTNLLKERSTGKGS